MFATGFLQSTRAVQRGRTALSRSIRMVHVHAGLGAGERPRRRHTVAQSRGQIREDSTLLLQQMDYDQ